MDSDVLSVTLFTGGLIAAIVVVVFGVASCEHHYVIKPCLEKRCTEGKHPVFMRRERVCICEETPQ